MQDYKVLCEKLILQLAPNHPLPVKPEHLVQPVKTSSEMYMARQRIARLEQELAQFQQIPVLGPSLPHPSLQIPSEQCRGLYQQVYFKLQECTQQKNALEDSLRAEILSSEEQRSYIEVLKQMIEDYLGEAGLSEITLEELRVILDNIKDKTQAKEIAALKHTVEQLKSQLQYQKSEFFALEREKEETCAQLQEAADALQCAEEELQRLEDEKSLVEHEFCNEKQLNQACLRETQQKLHNLTQDLQSTTQKNVNLEAENVKFKGKQNEASTELSFYKQKAQDSTEVIEKLTKQVKELNQKNKELEKKSNTYKTKYENLVISNTQLTDTLKNTQCKLGKTQDAFKVTQELSKGLQDSIELSHKQLEEVSFNRESQVRSLEFLLHSKEKEVAALRKKIGETGDLEKSQTRIQQLETELEKAQAKVSQDQTKVLTQINDLKQKLTDSHEKLRVAECSQAKILNTLETYNEFQTNPAELETDPLSLQIKSLIDSINSLKQENRSLKQQLLHFRKETETAQLALTAQAKQINVFKHSAPTENTPPLQTQYSKLSVIFEMIRLYSKAFKSKRAANPAFGKNIPSRLNELLIQCATPIAPSLELIEKFIEFSIEFLEVLTRENLDLLHATKQTSPLVVHTVSYNPPEFSRTNEVLSTEVLSKSHEERTELDLSLWKNEKKGLEKLLNSVVEAIDNRILKGIVVDVIRVRKTLEEEERKRRFHEQMILKHEVEAKMLGNKGPLAVKALEDCQHRRTQLNSSRCPALKAQLNAYEDQLRAFARRVT